MIEASQAAAARRRVFDRVAEKINVRLFAKDEVLIWDLVAHELADVLREWGGDGAADLIDPEVQR